MNIESEALGQARPLPLVLQGKVGWGGVLPSHPQAAWSTGKSSGLGARSPGSWFEFCYVAMTLREHTCQWTTASKWVGGLPWAPPSKVTDRESAGAKRKLQRPERSRKQPQRAAGAVCLALGLSPERAIAFATLSLEEIQLLVLEPPGPFMAAMYNQLSSLCSVSCVLRGHTSTGAKNRALAPN